jgi:hypothetical protein
MREQIKGLPAILPLKTLQTFGHFFAFFLSICLTTGSPQPETPLHSQSSGSLDWQSMFAQTQSFLQAFRQQY